MSTVRVLTPVCMPHTSVSNASRVCTRPDRVMRVVRSLNSSAVRVSSEEPTHTPVTGLVDPEFTVNEL